MIRVLLNIKHRLPFLWRVVERLNALLFILLHRKRVMANANSCIESYKLDSFNFRLLDELDARSLSEFLKRQPEVRTEFFKPHGFDLYSVIRQAKNPAFLMFGVFRRKDLVGYFFLRCFWNQKAFVGRIIDQDWEGQGIGRVMNNILYNTAWESGFKCLTTISKHNQSVIRSHVNNPTSHILGHLPNGYMLVEMVRPDQRSTGTRVRDGVSIKSVPHTDHASQLSHELIKDQRCLTRRRSP